MANSKFRIAVFAFLGIGIGVFAVPLLAWQRCSGNACSSVAIEKPGRCVQFRNLSDRMVEIRSPVGFTLHANSSYMPTDLGGQCYSNWISDYSAFNTGGVQSAGACRDVRPLRELGYGSGHKTKFCRKKGYAGVTNFPNSKYRDYGGGFCYTGDEQVCLDQMRGYRR